MDTVPYECGICKEELDFNNVTKHICMSHYSNFHLDCSDGINQFYRVKVNGQVCYTVEELYKYQCGWCKERCDFEDLKTHKCLKSYSRYHVEEHKNINIFYPADSNGRIYFSNINDNCYYDDDQMSDPNDIFPSTSKAGEDYKDLNNSDTTSSEEYNLQAIADKLADNDSFDDESSEQPIDAKSIKQFTVTKNLHKKTSSKENNLNIPNVAGKRKFERSRASWNSESELELLSEYAKQYKCKIVCIDWSKIKNNMFKKNYVFTNIQLQRKFQSLLDKYKLCKDSEGRSGQGVVRCKYYEEFENIFVKEPTIKPMLACTSIQQSKLHNSCKETNPKSSTTVCKEEKNLTHDLPKTTIKSEAEDSEDAEENPIPKRRKTNCEKWMDFMSARDERFLQVMQENTHSLVNGMGNILKNIFDSDKKNEK